MTIGEAKGTQPALHERIKSWADAGSGWRYSAETFSLPQVAFAVCSATATHSPEACTELSETSIWWQPEQDSSTTSTSSPRGRLSALSMTASGSDSGVTAKTRPGPISRIKEVVAKILFAGNMVRYAPRQIAPKRGNDPCNCPEHKLFFRGQQLELLWVGSDLLPNLH